MVGSGRRFTRTALLLASTAIVLAGCDFFASPFAGFLSGVEASRSVEIDSIIGEETSTRDVRFDLAVVGSGANRRVLLRVEPPAVDFVYRSRIIVFDTEMNEQARLQPESTIDYFSRPYGYGHDGNLLAGFSVFDLSGPTFVLKVTPHGLEGYVTTSPGPPASTHLFATPTGRFSAFTIALRHYQGGIWGLLAGATESIDIVPDGAALNADASQADLGYQLVGIARDGDDVLFLLSRPSEQYVVGARARITDIRAGASITLLPTSDAELFRISADRPQVGTDDDGFFLLRRNGWFERYDWSGSLVARVTGDTAFSREYAFDVEGHAFYRYDPETSVLTRIAGWW